MWVCEMLEKWDPGYGDYNEHINNNYENAFI